MFDQSFIYEQPYWVFDEESAQVYDEARLTNPIALKEFWKDVFSSSDIKNILKDLKKKNKLQILDLGCGTGRITIPLIDYLADSKKNFLFKGVDLSIPMLRKFSSKIEILKKNTYAKDVDKNINLLIGDATDLSYCFVFEKDKKKEGVDTESIDICIVNWLFHLVKDWQDIVWEIKRVLKRNGCLIMIYESSSLYEIANGNAPEKITIPCQLLEGYNELRNFILKNPPIRKRIGTFAEEAFVDSFLQSCDEDPSNKKIPIRRSWKRDVSVANCNKIISGRTFSNMQVVPNCINKSILEEINKSIYKELGDKTINDDSFKFTFNIEAKIYRFGKGEIQKDISSVIIMDYLESKVEEEFANVFMYYSDDKKYNNKVDIALRSVFARIFDTEKQVLNPSLFRKIIWLYIRYFKKNGSVLSGPYLGNKQDLKWFKFLESVYKSRDDYCQLVYLATKKSKRKGAAGIGTDCKELRLGEVPVSKDLLKRLYTGEKVINDIKREYPDWNAESDIFNSETYKRLDRNQRSINYDRLAEHNKRSIESIERELVYALKLESATLTREKTLRAIQNFFIYPGRVFYVFPAAIWGEEAGCITIGTYKPLSVEEYKFISTVSNLVFLRQGLVEKEIAEKVEKPLTEMEVLNQIRGDFYCWYPKIRFVFKSILAQLLKEDRLQQEITKIGKMKWCENVFRGFFLRKTLTEHYYIKFQEVRKIFQQFEIILVDLLDNSRYNYMEELEKALYSIFVFSLDTLGRFIPIFPQRPVWGKGILVSENYSDNLASKLTRLGNINWELNCISDFDDPIFMEKLKKDIRYCVIVFYNSDEFNDPQRRILTNMVNERIDRTSLMSVFLSPNVDPEPFDCLKWKEYFAKIICENIDEDLGKCLGTNT